MSEAPLSIAILHKSASTSGERKKLGPYEIETLISTIEEDKFTAYRVRIEPHTETATSYHKVAEELYYVLSGRGTAVLNGKEYALGPNDFLRLPPGTTHAFMTEAEPLLMLDIHSPGTRPDRDVFFVGEAPEGFVIEEKS